MLKESQQEALPSSPAEAVVNEGCGCHSTEIRSTKSTETDIDADGGRPFRARLTRLEEAYAHKVLYIIGKEQMKIKTDASFLRKVLLHTFLWIRDNTRNKMANLRVPTDKVIEVGFLKEI